ncbi:hypothetical protein FQN57_001092 [Myotisia sp. PD_48]|nr:hypothetical protein FQN57_001092 [Myotisia sp. PD_48]
MSSKKLPSHSRTQFTPSSSSFSSSSSVLTSQQRLPMTPDSRELEDSYNTHESLSLTSSVTDYPIESGRRYHRYHEGSYIYPNDEAEMDRQDMQYQMIKTINHGRIYFSPLDTPSHILDVGTGTGIWPIEMAEHYPETKIYGTDLSPTQPDHVPSNVQFFVDDATEPDWLWPPNHFDLIRTSMLLGSFTSYSSVIQTAFRYLKPGGHFEAYELDPACLCDDDTLPTGFTPYKSPYAFQNWMQYYEYATTMLEKPIRVAHQVAHWMRQAGFVDVEERVTKVPLNPWAKDPHLKQLGLWSQRNWLDGLAGFSYVPFGLKGLGWTQEEIEVFLVDVRKSIQDRKVHVYQNFYVVTGRKPS